jgi:hypothetical protein
MADQKISQLTGATTPLAGTEVLPIVQSGATRKVSVANLTAGRSTSVSELKVITANGQTNIVAGNTAGGNKIQAWNAAGNDDGYLGIEGFNIAYGQFTTAGNWAPANGLGIDFSATPGTGTSELLADYEEGTWTPDLTNMTVVGSPTVAGTYTKIGRFVYFECRVLATTIASTAGASYISGLPFTAGQVSSFIAINASSSVALGSGQVNGVILYTPTFGATAATISCSGSYEV